MTEQKREHIFVCVPSLRGQVTGSIASFFAACHKLNSQNHPFQYTTSVLEGIPGISLARNTIVKMFLDKPFDRLWMVDDDMVLPDTMFQLLAVEADIVAPLMPTFISLMDWNQRKFTFSMNYAAIVRSDSADPKSRRRVEMEDRPKGIMDVDGVGTGCTIIKRRVFEDPRMRLEPTYTNQFGEVVMLPDTVCPPYFRQNFLPNGMLESGEDTDFCYRAKDLGYSVRLAADIEIGHHKHIDIGSLFMIKRHLENCSASVPPEMV